MVLFNGALMYEGNELVYILMTSRTYFSVIVYALFS